MRWLVNLAPVDLRRGRPKPRSILFKIQFSIVLQATWAAAQNAPLLQFLVLFVFRPLSLD